MKKYYIYTVFFLLVSVVFTSCKRFLDVVPDNVATIDNAFTMRTQALKFLFTCYSYMPRDADPNLSPTFTAGDENWRPEGLTPPWDDEMFNIAKGLQNKVSPYPFNDHYWGHLYRALRDCNILLENIDKVPDMTVFEKNQWKAEVKFLKAYYHFYLVRMYGPVPLIKENLPVDASTEQVRVSRDPVDNCFNYITELLDEAAPDLPLKITNPGELGRITRPIALALKARVLVTAASPLFNGNIDQQALVNNDGTKLFNTQFDKTKWDIAVTACKEAVIMCEQQGIKLYNYTENALLSDTMRTQLSIRNCVAEPWNDEIIWANTQSISNEIQTYSQAHLDPVGVSNTTVKDNMSPTLKIAELFYSKNGVPINEDKTYNYNSRYTLRTAVPAEKLYMLNNYTSVYLHFDREPRFYANLGFDGGIWYGQGRYDDKGDLWAVQAKNGQLNGKAAIMYGSITGYWPKKLVHYQNIVDLTYVRTSYAWPLMRLADLYLLYAEALNESLGPNAEAYNYINKVRARAGLQPVETSWANFSTNPAKYTTQAGLRDIIQQERLIELNFEGGRFWDLRRWKRAAGEMNGPVKAWDIRQKLAADYYRPVTIFMQTFGVKDYFWPIADRHITANPNLKQNLGW
ncbi:MAG: RagB/SusD family nutrient uptake outer membrane protein [Niabella sp.]